MATGGKGMRTFMRAVHLGEDPKKKPEAPVITPTQVARQVAVTRAAGLPLQARGEFLSLSPRFDPEDQSRIVR